jgi:hypothetical protein
VLKTVLTGTVTSVDDGFYRVNVVPTGNYEIHSKRGWPLKGRRSVGSQLKCPQVRTFLRFPGRPTQSISSFLWAQLTASNTYTLDARPARHDCSRMLRIARRKAERTTHCVAGRAVVRSPPLDRGLTLYVMHHHIRILMFFLRAKCLGYRNFRVGGFDETVLKAFLASHNSAFC